ncbi:MAG: hypothetical protein DRN14_05475 [Thermoplasmata archaeon]|nr:MAG: hypothetical protein DRN14_05475 [Thermoplasmata archaeon]
MAFLTVNTESVQSEGGSGYINKSGIYSLTLKHCEITKTANGATQANYFFDKCMSYGNNLIGIQGQPTFGYKVIEALTTVIGEDSLSDPEPTTVTFKKGAKELSCIPELNDVQVKAWIQISYRMYKDEIKEDVSVRRFYRESDNASGSEVLSGENIGERFGKDESFASEIKYEDGTTVESVAAWMKAKQGGGSTPAPAQSATGGFPVAKKPAGFPGAK